MPKVPLVKPGRRAHRGCDGSLVFAVFAPFGTDRVLSEYPALPQPAIDQQPLVKALRQVAALGVNVSALVDLHDDDSWLVEIPAGRPKQTAIGSVWKQDMSAPQSLAGFLRRVHARFPRSQIVLSIEGHGAGYLPDIDLARITPASTTTTPGGGQLVWTTSEQGSSWAPAPGSPPLPVPSPVLPVPSPVLPATRMPISTWGMAAALAAARAAGVPAPVIVNFANCFNAALETMHTVAPHADYATGYANYDFFTAGDTYPLVFEALARKGGASALQLARWFALANGAVLKGKKNHPTVGATVPLSRMAAIGAATDALADALTKALTGAADRLAVRDAIQAAATRAQQYDTEPGFGLDVPDQIMDLASFARAVRATPMFGGGPDAPATRAATLLGLMGGLHQYGDYDRPWVDENQIWDFRDRDLALSIFFPDPDLRGQWDWRSPYYLADEARPDQPPALRHQIEWLSRRPGGAPPWPAFILEYHRGVAFKGLLPARPPFFPIFDREYKNKLPHPDPRDPPPDRDRVPPRSKD